MSTSPKHNITIRTEQDVARAVDAALRLSHAAGLNRSRSYLVATAVSELGTNICRYAGRGTITIRPVERNTQNGIEIVARDSGPGIADLDRALKDHFSSANSLGLGLGGVRRMMDEFEINTRPGSGTRIRVCKWG